METTGQYADYMASLGPGEDLSADVAALIAQAAPVKIWVLYCGDEDSPAECRFFSDELKAQMAGVDRVRRELQPGDVLEWRRAVAGPGLPVYAGPAPVVPRPDLCPDYQALFEVRADGSESFYWQLNSVLLDEPEPRVRRMECQDDPDHGLQEVISVAWTNPPELRAYRLACLHVAVGADEPPTSEP
jgi:hypothetical protein